jgi:hypothetical protein
VPWPAATSRADKEVAEEDPLRPVAVRRRCGAHAMATTSTGERRADSYRAWPRGWRAERERWRVAGRAGKVRKERKHRRQEWCDQSSSLRPDGATRRLPWRGECDPLRGCGCPPRRGKAGAHLSAGFPLDPSTGRRVGVARRTKLLLLGLLLQIFSGSSTVSIEEDTVVPVPTSRSSGTRERYRSEHADLTLMSA